jgi:pimeloyl-ACP methyl ester carboxylesterase
MLKNLLLTLFLTASVLSVYAQQMNTMEKSKTTGYAPVNGLNMYYEIYGSGTLPLVLIHGGGSTIESSFGVLLPLLSGYGKIIAVELQAHGRTNDRNAPESFEQDADDVAALLKYLKIGKANFLGFSNGGSTTMQIAIRHPAIVNKIVVIAGVYRRDGFIAGFFDGMEKATIDNMPPALKTAYLKVAPDKNNFQTMFERDKARMISFKDWSDESLRSIKAPALMMVGDKDVITVEHTLKMSALIPNARLAVVPGSHGSYIGEVCAVEKDSKMPEAVVVMVEEFLKE